MLANQLVGFSWSPNSEDKGSDRCYSNKVLIVAENILVTCGAVITQIARVQSGLVRLKVKRDVELIILVE